jgi:Xaa-Pro aminopeptidase
MSIARSAAKAVSAGERSQAAVPFDSDRLDAIMDKAGLDAIVASSKHNVQYLLGGYRFFFFEFQDAIGVSRYLPLFVYFKGRPQLSAYVANSMEAWERDNDRIWTPNVDTASWGSEDAMAKAVRHLKSTDIPVKRLGVERSFLPADAEAVLRQALPEVEIVDALVPLERLRARKTPAELDLLREASERVVDSMVAVFAGHGPGTTKRELVEAMKREEVQRGLVFEYCLVAAGSSMNRAPSDQQWREGEVLSLDSGGNYGGYIGDLCRMGILGEPDTELRDLLAEVDTIQQATRAPIRRGTLGGDLYAAAEAAIAKSPNRDKINFAAHGMGLISHEAPRLSSRAPVPYPGDDATEPLETGMVISIETAIHHPRRGFIKLEDTVAVTDTGWEAFGDHGRGWNRGGTAGA